MSTNPDSVANSDSPIVHNKEKMRFETEQNNYKGELAYKMEGSSKIDLLSVRVDPEIRNRGIAGRITKEALEYAKSNNLGVIPTCPYVQWYLRENEEYKSLVA